MRTGSAINFACVVGFCVAATTTWGGVGGVSHRITLPSGRGWPAVVKFASDRLVLLYWKSTRFHRPGDNEVVVLDRDGCELFARHPGLDVPSSFLSDLWVAVIYDATLGENGVLTVSIALVDTANRAVPALMEYDVARDRLLRITSTYPARCREIAADGENVWCLGANDESVRRGDMAYDVLNCFAPSGEIVQSLFPRSGFSCDPFRWRGRTRPQLAGSHGEFAAWLPGGDALLRWQSGGRNARQLTIVPPSPEDSAIGDTLVMFPGGRLVGLLAMGHRGGELSGPVRTPYGLNDAGMFSPLSSWSEVSVRDVPAGTDGDDLVVYCPWTQTIEWLNLVNLPGTPPTEE